MENPFFYFNHNSDKLHMVLWPHFTMPPPAQPQEQKIKHVFLPSNRKIISLEVQAINSMQEFQWHSEGDRTEKERGRDRESAQEKTINTHNWKTTQLEKSKCRRRHGIHGTGMIAIHRYLRHTVTSTHPFVRPRIREQARSLSTLDLLTACWMAAGQWPGRCWVYQTVNAEGCQRLMWW